MDFKLDPSNGYMYCYAPEHDLANKAGIVREHTYKVSRYIGRKLLPDECVHHIDRDRSNNSMDNLMLMTNSSHMALHQREDNNNAPVEKLICLICADVFYDSTLRNRKYCSHACRNIGYRIFEVSPSDLQDLLWEMPMTDIAKLYNVSGRAIRKRADKLSLNRPPVGHWSTPVENRITRR